MSTPDCIGWAYFYRHDIARHHSARKLATAALSSPRYASQIDPARAFHICASWYRSRGFISADFDVYRLFPMNIITHTRHERGCLYTAAFLSNGSALSRFDARRHTQCHTSSYHAKMPARVPGRLIEIARPPPSGFILSRLGSSI